MTITKIKTSCLDELTACTSPSALADLKTKYLGKSGALTGLLKGIKDLPAEERPTFGAKVNELRNILETAFADKLGELKAAEMQRKLTEETVDVSLNTQQP